MFCGSDDFSSMYLQFCFFLTFQARSALNFFFTAKTKNRKLFITKELRIVCHQTTLKIRSIFNYFSTRHNGEAIFFSKDAG